MPEKFGLTPGRAPPPVEHFAHGHHQIDLLFPAGEAPEFCRVARDHRLITTSHKRGSCSTSNRRCGMGSDGCDQSHSPNKPDYPRRYILHPVRTVPLKARGPVPCRERPVLPAESSDYPPSKARAAPAFDFDCSHRQIGADIAPLPAPVVLKMRILTQGIRVICKILSREQVLSHFTNAVGMERPKWMFFFHREIRTATGPVIRTRACDYDDGRNPGRTHTLENIDGSSRVDLHRFARSGKRYGRIALSGQMENAVRPKLEISVPRCSASRTSQC